MGSTELAAGWSQRLAGAGIRAMSWDGDRLSWLDSRGGRLLLGRWRQERVRHFASLGLDGRVRSAAAVRDGWLVAGESGVAHLRGDGRVRPTDLPGADLLACDPGGRLWLATPEALCRVDLRGRVVPVLPGPTGALAWSPDAATLYRGTGAGLDAYRFDLVNGVPTAPRRLCDGPVTAVAVDLDGCPWTATPDGVLRLAPPVGALVSRLELVVATPDGIHRLAPPMGSVVATVPLTGVTGCCFVADTLLVTTDGDEVVACRAGVAGRPDHRVVVPRFP